MAMVGGQFGVQRLLSLSLRCNPVGQVGLLHELFGVVSRTSDPVRPGLGGIVSGVGGCRGVGVGRVGVLLCCPPGRCNDHPEHATLGPS